MSDALLNNKIKSLKLKGFSKEEIMKLLEIDEENFFENSKGIIFSDDINISSTEYYSELQKDLSKLVMTELNKEKRDSNVVLDAIKLQANLQEKKLFLGRKSGEEKISKDYIYERDKEIVKCKKNGMTEEEIAKKYGISVLTISKAIDRNSLELDDKLKTLSPSIIDETIGLDKKERMELLEKAYRENINRTQMRKIVNGIKNEGR